MSITDSFLLLDWLARTQCKIEKDVGAAKNHSVYRVVDADGDPRSDWHPDPQDAIYEATKSLDLTELPAPEQPKFESEFVTEATLGPRRVVLSNEVAGKEVADMRKQVELELQKLKRCELAVSIAKTVEQIYPGAFAHTPVHMRWHRPSRTKAVQATVDDLLSSGQITEEQADNYGGTLLITRGDGEQKGFMYSKAPELLGGGLKPRPWMEEYEREFGPHERTHKGGVL
jgi:hypothetical protein